MTKEDIAECIKVMQAYVEGKQIQYVDSETEDWADIESPIWNWDTYDYRIKPEPKYRPFKDADECWQEMLKHEPFGWIKEKGNKPSYELLACISENNESFVGFASYGSAVGMGVTVRSNCEFSKTFNGFTFADGAPFGVKED